MRRTREEAMKTRKAVLDAASRTITGLGIGKFTIDAVAQEAGVTKGGVMHHFPSKEALVDSMIEQVLRHFQARVQCELDKEPAGVAGRWLRAYIRAVFPTKHEEMNLLPALAAAVAADPATIDRIRSGMAMNQAAVTHDGVAPAIATIVRLAVDGAIFARAFHLDVLDETTRAVVRAELLAMTQ